MSYREEYEERRSRMFKRWEGLMKDFWPTKEQQEKLIDLDNFLVQYMEKAYERASAMADKYDGLITNGADFYKNYTVTIDFSFYDGSEENPAIFPGMDKDESENFMADYELQPIIVAADRSDFGEKSWRMPKDLYLHPKRYIWHYEDKFKNLLGGRKESRLFQMLFFDYWYTIQDALLMKKEEFSVTFTTEMNPATNNYSFGKEEAKK